MGLGSPGSSRVDLICNKAICMSNLVSIHFLIVCFINFMHSSTCPLLCWWYDNDTACSMFRFLLKLLNLSEIKLPSTSNTIFCGKPKSEKIWLCMLVLGYLPIGLMSFWWQETYCDNLQNKGSFYFVGWTCLCQLLPMVCLGTS